jgi:hypothetical protein
MRLPSALSDSANALRFDRVAVLVARLQRIRSASPWVVGKRQPASRYRFIDALEKMGLCSS